MSIDADETARLRRNLQATHQALLDTQAELGQVRPPSDAMHGYCSAVEKMEGPEGRYADVVRAREAMFAVHRATTPSPTLATHVVVAVDDLKRIRDLARDGLASSAMAVLDRILGAT